MKLVDFDTPFGSQSTDDWLAKVSKELKGKPFQDHLEFKSSDGIELHAWSDSSNHLPINLPPRTNPWKLLHPVYQEDAAKANAEALQALMNGAESIWFEKSFYGAAQLLACKDIDTSIAPVFVRSSSITDIHREFLKTGEKPNYSDVSGSVLVHGLRLRERGATIIQEVAYSIAQGIHLLNNGVESKDIYFSSGIGSSYLAEMAKIRAFRTLWAGVLQAYGQKTENPLLIGVNLAISYTKSDEYTNILRATSSALSGILGGVEFMMIEPWNRTWEENVEFSSRISRNVQNLLRDEGRLDKNLNAPNGSYFIDNLTHQIAEKAWEEAREIQTLGDFLRFTESGELNGRLSKSREELVKSVSSGDQTVLGLNRYQPKEEKEEPALSRTQYLHLPDYVHLPSEIQNT